MKTICRHYCEVEFQCNKKTKLEKKVCKMMLLFIRERTGYEITDTYLLMLFERQ